MRILQTRMQTLAVRRDQEQTKFTAEFEEALRSLGRFRETSKCLLLRKAGIEYLSSVDGGARTICNVRDITTLEKAQWALVAYREEIQQGLIEAQAEVRFTNWLEQQTSGTGRPNTAHKKRIGKRKADLTRAK